MDNEKRSLRKITCFGEILWDVFPGSVNPGGAPMNVAYHLRRLGVHSNIVSRLGRDERGDQLIKILEGWRLSTDYIQVDSHHATSEVQARMDENEEVTYEIIYPVAWDFLEWRDDFEMLLETTDAFVFGSLASRNETTYKTLLAMLELAAYKVFDVNLRYPNYTEKVVKNLLNQTDLLKLNQSELDIICEWVRPGNRPEKEKIKIIQDNFKINEIIVTKGGKGASFYSDDSSFNSKVYPVKVADTVGSGDAFLAAFLANHSGSDLQHQLDYASALGAFVASKVGACPDYNRKELEQFFLDH